MASSNTQFENLTDQITKTFKSKKKKYPPFLFARVNIKEVPVGYFLEQKSYAKGLTKLEKTVSFETFCTTRHKLAWIINIKPEITTEGNILSNITDKT